MPTPTKGPRLGGGSAHQRLMLANLATALFEHGRITTTEAKAKRLRPLAERLITKAKRGDLHARRQVQTVVRDKDIVHELFTEIGPRYGTRPGGYTRITKLGPRKGDNAPMAMIELVEPLAEETVAEAEGATKRAARTPRRAKKAAGSAAPAAPLSEAVEADETGGEDQPAEDVTSDQTATAEDTSQAEGDAEDAVESGADEESATDEAAESDKDQA